MALVSAMYSVVRAAFTSQPVQQAVVPAARRLCSSWVAEVKNPSFLRRKYAALFKVYDTNQDGLFCSEDVKIYQQQIASVAKLEGDRLDKFLTYSNDFFEGWVSLDDKKLTQEEFVSQLLWYRQEMPVKFKDVLVNKSFELHHALDFNGDGYVEMEEFLTWARYALIDDRNLGKLLFNLIDEDSDHKLKVEEMIHFFVGFMMHENKDPASQLFFDIAGASHGV